MSGLVRDNRQVNQLTYKALIPALFNKWIILSDLVLLLLDHGSSVGMLPSFPISLSKSRVYFVWEMKIPFLLLVTSIPGKCCSCPRSLTTNSDYRHYYCSILQILGVVSYKLPVQEISFYIHLVQSPIQICYRRNWDLIGYTMANVSS